MKLPSIKILLKGGLDTFLRFPFAIITAIAGTIISIYVIDLDYKEIKEYQYLVNIIHTCIIGLALFISITLFSEQKQLKELIKYVLRLTGVALLAGYYYYLPEDILLVHIIRAILIGLGLHCLVAFAGFIKKGRLNGFWQFNKELFIRLLTALLYTGVLYGGLSLAMVAIDQLLGVEIDDKYYFKLWVVMAGVFNIWFFLAGVPKDFKKLEASDDYPKGLKIFTQYVLIPLVTIYVLILYIYVIKIIIDWEWPVGWVSYLVLSFSITGIFALLLVYPIQNIITNKWIRTYSKWFYWALFPLIVLLFLAVWRRVSEYGFTENRYFVLILAFWLAGISIYLLINNLKNIKIIPISLCLIAFLSSFGPWGAFSISKESQLKRLENVLSENNILINGKIQKVVKKKISFNDIRDISSIVEYLSDIHGYKTLQPFYKENLDTIFFDSLYLHKPTELVSLIGLEYINKWQRRQDEYYEEHFYYYMDFYNQQNVFNIKDYKYFFNYSNYFYNYDDIEDTIYTNSYKVQEGDLKVIYSPDDISLNLTMNDSMDLHFNLKPLITTLGEKYPTYNSANNISLDDMTLEAENNNMKVKIYFIRLNGNRSKDDNKVSVTDLQAVFLIKIKKID